MKKKERQKNHPKLPNSDNLLKQAQEKLQESEERYKSLFDRSLDLVYLHDFQGRFLDANDAALKRLGYTKEEIHSLNFASFLSEDQIPIAIKSTEILLAGTQKGLTEYRLKHKDGSDVYVETRGSIVMS
ncbi:MAG TPA: PAS domain S-box protein, partial [Smithella sp.]|nr:PAS domain S-box protein [Smithella sp.]